MSNLPEVRRLLPIIVVLSACAAAIPATSAAPVVGRVCVLDGTHVSGGGGRGEYTYALSGRGTCRLPTSTISITTTSGGAEWTLQLPTCRPLQQLGVPNGAVPGTDDVVVDVALTEGGVTRTLHSRWELVAETGPLTQSVLTYGITGDVTGRAVVTAAAGTGAPTCVAGAGSRPVTIDLQLA